ncbi:MAG: 4-hydroxy-tetrahydrodipicolinate reductase [Gammaproteobacteria bacterium]
MPIRVLVNGANGRMGKFATAAIEADPELELVAQTDRHNNLREAIDANKTQVVVDFTTAESAYDNLATIVACGAHPVIGTSGLLTDQITHMQTQCAKQHLGGIIAPNFSIGAVLMMKYAQDAARYLDHVEIIELHHDQKQDSPSGTALKTADMIAENLRSHQHLAEQKETIPGARGARHHNIHIHALRLPGLVAHQQVIFGAQGETLTIRHDSLNRECFMPGVLLACKKVMDLNELVYGLEHIL